MPAARALIGVKTRDVIYNVINLSLTVFFDTASGIRGLGLFSCLSGTCVLGAQLLPHRPYAAITAMRGPVKRVFDLVKDFGTSKSPKSTRSSTTHWCPGRPSHPAFRHNIASSLRLHTGFPYDWTPRSDAPLGSPLAPSARRASRVASRLPGTTRLRFALHGGQRAKFPRKA